MIRSGRSRGLPALLRRHRAAGWGIVCRLPALSSRPGAAGEDSGARRGAGKWGRDPRLARAQRGPAPAASGPAAARARAPPSASRRPRSLLPPPSLARSLPPPGRLGADSAARCSRGWKMAGNDCGALLDEELSSFFLNYLADTQVRPAGAAGPGPGVLSCGGCRRSRGGLEAAVGALGGTGVPGCRAPPFYAPCDALCYGGREREATPPRKPERGGATAAGEGLASVAWSPLPPPAEVGGTAFPWGGGAAPRCGGLSGWPWVPEARPQTPGTCCRTFTWTCGPGSGACFRPRSAQVLRSPVPRVLLLAPRGSPSAPAARSFLPVAG